MQTIHLLPLVHLKFRVNAVISVGATFKKLQKSPKNRFFTAFCSILTNVQMTQRLNIWYVYTTTHLVCPNRISSQCHLFCGSYIRKRHFYSIFTAFIQKALRERFHYSWFQFPTDISYIKPLRNPGYISVYAWSKKLRYPKIPKVPIIANFGISSVIKQNSADQFKNIVPLTAQILYCCYVAERFLSIAN